MHYSVVLQEHLLKMQLILNCSNLYPLHPLGTAFPGYVDAEILILRHQIVLIFPRYIDVNKLNRHFLSEGLLFIREVLSYFS